MNPVFIVLVILIGVIIWFSINSLFPFIGNIICGLIDETKINIENANNEDKEDKEF